MFELYHSYEKPEEYAAYYDFSAKSVGKRIKSMRISKGKSRAELGALIGLSADRVQKYENGARKPKLDMVVRIAEALEVSPYAIMEPVMGDYLGIMYCFFNLEEDNIIKVDQDQNENVVRLTLIGGVDDPLVKAVKLWIDNYRKTSFKLEQAESEEEKNIIREAYNQWKWNFPNSLPYESEDKEQKRVKLRKEIEALQKEYNQLVDE